MEWRLRLFGLLIRSLPEGSNTLMDSEQIKREIESHEAEITRIEAEIKRLKLNNRIDLAMILLIYIIGVIWLVR